MICENTLCIYQENNVCILDEISINALGMCDEYICPDIDTLDEIKRETRQRLDEEFYK